MTPANWTIVQAFPTKIREEIAAWVDKQKREIPTVILLYWRDILAQEGRHGLDLEWKCWKSCVRAAKKKEG